MCAIEKIDLKVNIAIIHKIMIYVQHNRWIRIPFKESVNHVSIFNSECLPLTTYSFSLIIRISFDMNDSGTFWLRDCELTIEGHFWRQKQSTIVFFYARSLQNLKTKCCKLTVARSQSGGLRKWFDWPVVALYTICVHFFSLHFANQFKPCRFYRYEYIYH